MLMNGGVKKTFSKQLIVLTLVMCLLPHSNLVLALEDGQKPNYQSSQPCDFYDDLAFNSTAANSSIKWQVDLGHRLPGSDASYNLRESIKENLTQWQFREETHAREDFNLTNLIATYEPENSSGQEIFFVAHYDSRDRAERDENESMRDKPIDGANDGASGVAVLIELAKIIPTMELNHTVRLLFTDGEDQGVRPGIYGSKAWAENKTDSELNKISAFIVVDMIGDYDLHFTHVWPGSSELWLTIQPLAIATGLVDGELDCNGNPGEDIFDIETSNGVIDDHVAAHERGVPAIDLIDIRSGEGAENWGGYWHTHNDTIDKVSAQSLGRIGELLELGLRSSSWIIESETSQENQSSDIIEEIDNGDSINIETFTVVGLISIVIIFCLFTVIFFLDYRIRKV
tara:strand:- start:360 stop:1559 length:1200 start_codon:yes stop_codon:yes gene_type:complete